MADVKISALPAATTPLAGTEVLPIVQSSTTDQVSVANLTAGRAVSAASLTLTTTPLAAGSGGTGLSSLGTGVATGLGAATNAASGFVAYDGSGNLSLSGLTTLASGAGISIASVSVTSPASGDGNVFSGTYTPSQVSTNTNISAITFNACQYMRVGNSVTISGQVTATVTTANTNTVILMSLPIASSFGSSVQLGGTTASVSSPYNEAGAMLANTTNACIEFRFRSTTTTSRGWSFSCTYRIV